MDKTMEEKLARAKAYLGEKWLLHPANRVRRLSQPLPRWLA